ncbi:restriction endonuclease subunit S [Candidatus Bipolaricaulis anaerobius]|jgi:type I restriction enzyme S subunit|nr:restriction endonuclease subunit S [Candidatus Bipolaricaulis anaerobius]
MTEGLYKLPEGWRWVRLGEVCNLYQPKTITVQEMKRNPGPYPVFGANGIIGNYYQFNHEESEVLVTCRGATCGTVNMSSPRSWITGNAMVVTPVIEGLRKDYLYWVIKSTDLREAIGGSAQPQITRLTLSPMIIPLPPLDEQRRIVARIEELMAQVREARRLRQQAKEDAERLWQSTLAETFPRPGAEPPPGWRWVRLGEVCEVWDTLRKPVKKKVRIPGNVPYCGANGVIDYVDGHTHAGEFVLLAEDGGFYGPGEPTAYIMSGRFWANNHVHILRGRPDHLVNQLLYYCLVAYDLRPFLTGATRPKLTQGAMRSIPIPLPPLDEQRRILAHLEAVQEKIKALKEIQATTDAEFQLLEQAILDRAFRGEL